MSALEFRNSAPIEAVIAGKVKAGLVTRLRFIQLVVELADDDDEASLDIGLDLQAARDCLIVVIPSTSLDAALKPQTTSHGLIVIAPSTGFDVRFDFHTRNFPFG
jgi:hypothetical protein